MNLIQSRTKSILVSEGGVSKTERQIDCRDYPIPEKQITAAAFVVMNRHKDVKNSINFMESK